MRVLKIILIPLFSIIFLIAAFLGVSYFLLHDRTNDMPLSLYKETETLQKEVENFKMEALRAADLTDKEEVFIGADQDRLNKIIYASLKEAVKNYDPNSENKENKYLFHQSAKIPVLGDASFTIKGVYTNFYGQTLNVYVPMEAMETTTCLTVEFKINQDETTRDIEIVLSKVKLGVLKLSPQKLSKYLNKFNFNVENFTSKINENLQKNDIPVSIVDGEFKAVIKRKDLEKKASEAIAKISSGDDKEKLIYQKTVEALMALDNNLIDFGVYNNNMIGIKVFLRKLKVSKENLINVDSLKGFNPHDFVQMQAQAFLINSLVYNTPTASVSFSQDEFNKMIYKTTEAYKDFKYEGEVNGVKMSIKVEAIEFILNETSVQIRVNMNLNGLKTLAIVNTKVVKQTAEKTILKFEDQVVMGQDPNENPSEYLHGSGEIVFYMLAKNLSSSVSLLNYNENDKTFEFSGDTLETLMLTGSNATASPVDFTNLKIGNGVITGNIIFYPHTTFGNNLANAIASLKEILKTNNLISLSNFQNLTPDQEAIVNNIVTQINTITEGTNNNTPIPPEVASGLVENISNLTEENKAQFMNQFNSAIGGNAAILHFMNNYFKK